jgi:hypothetical protein
MQRALSLILLLAIVSGCGKAAAPKTKSVIPIEQVPEVVMKAAQKKEPDVKFHTVIKTADGIYEVQGKKTSGKIIEVEVSENGGVVKVE